MPKPRTKRRGRKRKNRSINDGKKDDEVNLVLDDDASLNNDLESITAQTATNLKAFRLLFGSYEEETEEEFPGYSAMEVVSVKAACRRRRTKISNEIAHLESLFTTAQVRVCALPQQTPATSMPQSSTSAVTQPPADVNADNTQASTAQASAASKDLKFAGFLESDPILDTCRAKSRKLFDLCGNEELKDDFRLIDNHIDSANSQISSQCLVGKIQQPCKRKNGLKSPSKRSPEIILKNFGHSQSIAGEITVTPILQSDVPMAVKVTHGSPFLISCLPKM